MTIDLSIVSGTFNRLNYLKAMVESVRRSLAPSIKYEIILIDGGSTDGTQEWLRGQGDIHLIEHGKLLGAIKAFNDGAHEAKGRYVVLGNDDITFEGDSLTRALTFIQGHPETGIGCFYTNRGKKGLHVAEMPAHYPNGEWTSVPYGGLVILPRWLGDRLDWWTCPGAKTYGGDCALCARSWEAGWPVVAMPGCTVNEHIPGDALNAINNPPTSDDHPDTQAYLKLFPRGPMLRPVKLFHAPTEFKPPARILYMPIYELNHAPQHAQKCGLRRALQRKGLVQEIDYAVTGPEAILDAARDWQPDMVVIQAHYPEPFTPSHARRLRDILPYAKILAWNGDVYDMTVQPKYATDYLDMLRFFDLTTVVNYDAVVNYRRAGINCHYWQLGYEPTGVGHEPTADTKHHDIVFMGNGYSTLRQVFGRLLKSLPYNVGVYGQYWPEFEPDGHCLYDFKQGCRIYRAATIAIGDSQWPVEARGFTSNRLFQCLAAGGALMLHEWFWGCEELLGLMDGEHLVLWKGEDDLRAKLAYWLDPAHAAERLKLVKQGQLAVLRHHSFEARVEELWRLIYPTADVTNNDPTLAAFHSVRL